jgi:hypothetical protein
MKPKQVHILLEVNFSRFYGFRCYYIICGWYFARSLNQIGVSQRTPSSPAHSPVLIKTEFFYHFDSIRGPPKYEYNSQPEDKILNQFFVFSVVSNETGNIVQRN